MFLKKHKFIFFFILPIFLLCGVFFVVPNSVNAADPIGWITGVVGNILIAPVSWIIYAIVKLLANVLIVIIQILIAVSLYNGFIDAPAVTEGWVIIRDLANMFFVIVLLIIAISTILGLESYNYKKLLPKLLLMAILINFSKMICGLLIDVSQVVTMTFVDGYKNAAAGNLATAFGLDQLLSYGWKTEAAKNAETGLLEIMGALILALVLLIVAISVTVGTILIFLIRIIMLWFLVVLSPIAYLCSAFPGGSKYSGQWWTEFTKYLIIGPAMAFFLWLSLTVMSTADVATTQGFRTIETKEKSQIIEKEDSFLGVSDNLSGTISSISSSSHLLSYIIAIGMLCGSMMMASQIGVAGAGMAMKVAKSVGIGGSKLAYKGTLGWAGKKMYAGELPFGIGKGVLLNPMELMKRWGEGRKGIAEERMRKGDVEAGKNMGKGGWGGALTGMGAEGYYKNYTGWSGFQKTFLTGGALRVGRWDSREEQRKLKRDEVTEEDKISGEVTSGPNDKEKEKYANDNNIVLDSTCTAINPEDKVKMAEFEKEWKVKKAKQWDNGPLEDDIENHIDGINITRVSQGQKKLKGEDLKNEKETFIKDWKNKNKDTYLGAGADAKKVSDGFEKIGKINKKQDNITPDTVEDKIKEKSLVSTIKDKHKDFTVPQLTRAFKNALEAKDELKMKAILALIAEKEGLDDLLRTQGRSEDTEGYKGFMKEITGKGKLNMDTQEALGLQAEIGAIAGRQGQVQFDKTVSVNKKSGEYKERDKNEIDLARYNEIRASKSGREIFQKIPKLITEKTGEITDPGKLLIQDGFQSIKDLVGRGELSPELIKLFNTGGKNGSMENMLKKLWKNENNNEVDTLIDKIQKTEAGKSLVNRVANAETDVQFSVTKTEQAKKIADTNRTTAAQAKKIADTDVTTATTATIQATAAKTAQQKVVIAKETIETTAKNKEESKRETLEQKQQDQQEQQLKITTATTGAAAAKGAVREQLLKEAANAAKEVAKLQQEIIIAQQALAKATIDATKATIDATKEQQKLATATRVETAAKKTELTANATAQTAQQTLAKAIADQGIADTALQDAQKAQK